MTAPSKAMELKAAITAIFAAMTAFWGWTGWLVIVWLAAMNPGLCNGIVGGAVDRIVGQRCSACRPVAQARQYRGHAGRVAAGCGAVGDYQLWRIGV